MAGVIGALKVKIRSLLSMPASVPGHGCGDFAKDGTAAIAFNYAGVLTALLQV
jgi:hypothetical protein